MTFYWRDSPARLPVHVRENLLFSGVPTVRAMQNGLLHHNIPSAVRLAVALNDRLGRVRTADPSHLSFRSPFLAIVRVSTHRFLSSWTNFEVHSWYFALHPVLLCRKSTYLQLILVGVTPHDRPTGDPAHSIYHYAQCHDAAIISPVVPLSVPIPHMSFREQRQPSAAIR